ncbi:hypothetical protein B0H14DRAFT_2610593 [Mycena olivaceomarginata]|nr:hypothetical protein B0H14DRAFT_2610593 [Mycena olivaceomarginata]
MQEILDAVKSGQIMEVDRGEDKGVRRPQFLMPSHPPAAVIWPPMRRQFRQCFSSPQIRPSPHFPYANATTAQYCHSTRPWRALRCKSDRQSSNLARSPVFTVLKWLGSALALALRRFTKSSPRALLPPWFPRRRLPSPTFALHSGYLSPHPLPPVLLRWTVQAQSHPTTGMGVFQRQGRYHYTDFALLLVFITSNGGRLVSTVSNTGADQLSQEIVQSAGRSKRFEEADSEFDSTSDSDIDSGMRIGPESIKTENRSESLFLLARRNNIRIGDSRVDSVSILMTVDFDVVNRVSESTPESALESTQNRVGQNSFDSDTIQNTESIRESVDNRTRIDVDLTALTSPNECFCGNELGGTASLSPPGSGLAIPQTECNMPCAGDGSSTCFPPFVVRLTFNLGSAGTIRGGGSRLSLYTVPALARRGDGVTLRRGLERRTFPNPTSNIGPISTTPTATANPTPSATCYVDSCDKPSLPFLGSTKATQTVSGCIAECGAAGFELAGLSWGDECFCRNDLGSTARLEPWKNELALALPRLVPLIHGTIPPSPSSAPNLPCRPSAECAAANYKLAGLSWANECFCGNELAGTAALTTPGSGLALPQTESNMPCAGGRAFRFDTEVGQYAVAALGSGFTRFRLRRGEIIARISAVASRSGPAPAAPALSLATRRSAGRGVAELSS